MNLSKKLQPVAKVRRVASWEDQDSARRQKRIFSCCKISLLTGSPRVRKGLKNKSRRPQLSRPPKKGKILSE